MASFNYNHLFYFYVTAKMGGVTEAARKLHTSQSSLSSQLKILEANLNIQLFLKSGRRLELTDRGQAVLAHCEKIFSAAESLNSYVQTMRGDNSPLIRCGVSKDLGGSFVGRVLARVFLCAPTKQSTRVRMEAAVEADLRKKLQMRELDMALTAESIPADGIQFVRRINMPVSLIGSVKTAEALPDPSASISEIFSSLDLGLALPLAGSAFRGECESFMAENDLKKRISYESDSVESIMSAIEDGLAIGFAPSSFARTGLSRGQIQILGAKEPCWNHQIFLYSQSEKDGQNIISAIEGVL